MIRLLDLHGPGAARVPRVPVEQAAHHLGRFRPVVEVVGRRVDSAYPFAALDKVHQRLAVFRVLERQPRRIVEHHRIVLGQRRRIESGHLLADLDFPSPRLLTDQFEGRVSSVDGTVNESLAAVEHQQPPRLFRLGSRLAGHRFGDLLQFVVGDRLQVGIRPYAVGEHRRQRYRAGRRSTGGQESAPSNLMLVRHRQLLELAVGLSTRKMERDN